MKTTQKVKIIHKAYTKAKKRIKLDGRNYYLYEALFRKENNFKHLIPYLKEEYKNIKIILDAKSDMCLVYGSKHIIKLIKEQEKIRAIYGLNERQK